MNPWRYALLGGLLYGLAYGTWLLAGLEPGPAAPDLVPAHRALLWVQALALVLLLPAIAAAGARPLAPPSETGGARRIPVFTPPFEKGGLGGIFAPSARPGAPTSPIVPLRRSTRLNESGALLLLAAVPWPLLTLPALTGSIPVAALATGQAAIAAWGLLLLGLWSAVPRLLPATWRSCVQGMVQATALVAAIWGLPPVLAVLQL